MVSSTIRSIALVVFILGPISSFSQTFPSLAAAVDKQLLKPAELDQIVAPIALYPDTLLSEVLMASTYPLEVVQAERWLNANKSLKGDQLKDAVDKQSWDDSVKSLTATPSVLKMMNSKIDWTQKLGNAVIDQQADVMDAIQRLRAKAQANNKLQTTEQQKVVVSQEQGRQVIAIEPTDPNTVYVPYCPHEYRHRYNVGEFAASLLQSLAQASEERAYLPIEIAGKRFPARIGGRRRLAGEPHGAAALGHHGLRISVALREICLDEASLR